MNVQAGMFRGGPDALRPSHRYPRTHRLAGFDRARALAPGERILIHGAAGDVGAFTVRSPPGWIMIVYATAATASGI